MGAQPPTRIRTDVPTFLPRNSAAIACPGSKDVTPGRSLLLRADLWRNGFRYRLKSKLYGKPDLVFPTAIVAVFVDGCQWHCCPQHWVRPKSNTDFWDRKFETNRNRDADVNKHLHDRGWTVLRFWEHEIERDCSAIVDQIAQTLRNGK